MGVIFFLFLHEASFISFWSRKNINKKLSPINYELPKEIGEYVHRVGRTGRAGNKGKSTSFFDPERDDRIGKGLTNALMQNQTEIPEFLKKYIEPSGVSALSEGMGKIKIENEEDSDGDGW